MKTIKFKIFIAFLSLVSLFAIHTYGQETILFSATYSYGELTSWLDPDDSLYYLLDTGQTDPGSSRLGNCREADTDRLWSYVYNKRFLKQLPGDIWFAWGKKTEADTRTLFALRKSDVTGVPGINDIRSVSVQKGDAGENYDLLIMFTGAGADKWATLTRENVGRDIAIVIRGEVVTAPRVMEEIVQGKCRISGDFSRQEADEIRALLGP
jgi:SecD/SecF fusion protein